MTSPIDTRTCDDIEPLLPLVADGTLDDSDDHSLFDHLAQCERCQNSLAAHDLISIDLPKVYQTSANGSSPTQRLHLHRWVPLAMAASIVLTIGFLLMPAGTTTTATTPATATATATAKPAVPTIEAVAVKEAAPVVAARSTAAAPAAADSSPVDMEVIALPGRGNNVRYLVRRGEQMMLVDPSAPAVTTDTLPASYSY